MENVDDALEERKNRVNLGSLYTEMRKIVRSINRRRYAEPTPREKARLAAIREEINKREGRSDEPG